MSWTLQVGSRSPSRTTPTTPTNRQTKDVNKVTPGGTRLPDGPPPVDKVEKDPMPPPLPPVPPMPLGDYEEYNEAGANKWLGPQTFRVGAQQADGRSTWLLEQQKRWSSTCT